MSTFNGAVVEKIGEETVEFPRLLLPEYETIQNAVAAQLKARAVELANECGLKGADRFVALRDNTPEFPRFHLVEAYLDTKAGVELVLRKSLQKTGAQEASIVGMLAKIDFPTGRDIAFRVICFRVDPKAQPQTDPVGTNQQPGAEAAVSATAT